MATSKEFLSFILEQLSHIEGITHRQMMGEYIIYIDKRIAFYLCDDRLLAKPVPSAVRLLPNAEYEFPYEGASKMILVEDVDNKEFLSKLITEMRDELPPPKNKRK